MHIIQSIKLIFCARLNNTKGMYTQGKINQKIGEACVHTNYRKHDTISDINHNIYSLSKK